MECVGVMWSVLLMYFSLSDVHDQLHNDHREMKIQYYQLKQENDELKEKMSFFTQVNIVWMATYIMELDILGCITA